MKVIDKIKHDINEISDPIEMAGYLNGITVGASMYCKQNCPDEIIIDNGKLVDITISGMCYYLDSEIEK